MSATPSLADRLKTEGVFDEFAELMFGVGTRYEDLLEQLEKWGISSSLGALSRFRASHRGPWAMERARRAEKDFLEQHGANLDEAERRMVAMRIFQEAANPNTTTKDVLRMRDQHLGGAKLQLEREKVKQAEVKLQQAERKLEQAERKLKLLESKIEATKEDLENPSLTEAERAARMRARFGV